MSHDESRFRHEKAFARLFTLDQTRVRMITSNALLAQFRRNKSELWRQLITVDATKLHHIIRPQQKYSQNSVLKKAKSAFLAEKVIAAVFCDSRGVILIDYVQSGKTITGPYFASLIYKLNAKFAEKRLNLLKKNLFD